MVGTGELETKVQNTEFGKERGLSQMLKTNFRCYNLSSPNIPFHIDKWEVHILYITSETLSSMGVTKMP